MLPAFRMRPDTASGRELDIDRILFSVTKSRVKNGLSCRTHTKCRKHGISPKCKLYTVHIIWSLYYILNGIIAGLGLKSEINRKV